MIVITSRLRVTSGTADALAERYRRRARVVEGFPGCLGVEVLRHLERPDEFVVVSRWSDEDSYAAYRRHPAFRVAHAGIGEIAGGVRVASGERAVDRYEVLS